jgi:hypothetical protein
MTQKINELLTKIKMEKPLILNINQYLVILCECFSTKKYSKDEPQMGCYNEEVILTQTLRIKI